MGVIAVAEAVTPRPATRAKETGVVGKARIGVRAYLDRGWYQRAVELDPDFANAHVGIASIYSELYTRGLISREAYEGPTRAAIERAMALEPTSGSPFAALGSFRNMICDLAGSEAAYQQSIKLKTRDSNIYLHYAYLLLESLGRPAEAVCFLEKAVAMDPLCATHRSLLGESLAAAGRTEEGIRLLHSNIKVDPNFAANYWRLGTTYALCLGRLDKGIRWFAQTLVLEPDNYMFYDAMRFHLSLGDTAGATRCLNHLNSAAPGSYHALAGRYILQRYQNASEQALKTARMLAALGERVAGYYHMASLAWLRQLQSVDPKAALGVYEHLYPELVTDPPAVDANNYAAAAGLGQLRRQAGDDAAAARLLRDSLAILDTLPVVGPAGHHATDVLAHTIAGNREQAMASFKRALDAGWHAHWWLLRVDRTFEPLWELPEFQRLRSDVEAEMATQLANLREMERRGELTAVPRNEAIH